MMKLQLQIMSDVDNFKEVINNVAIDLFHANTAVELQPGEFNIDAGINNIRAYWRSDQQVIEFICRYQKDLDITTQRIRDYGVKNNLSLISITKSEIANHSK